MRPFLPPTGDPFCARARARAIRKSRDVIGLKVSNEPKTWREHCRRSYPGIFDGFAFMAVEISVPSAEARRTLETAGTNGVYKKIAQKLSVCDYFFITRSTIPPCSRLRDGSFARFIERAAFFYSSKISLVRLHLGNRIIEGRFCISRN